MWLNDILSTNEKGNPPNFSDLSDLQKTQVGQKIIMQTIENTALSDLSDLSDPKKNRCQTKADETGRQGEVDEMGKAGEPVKEADFCPLEFLNERGVGVMDIDPVKGILLTTDYACSDTLRNMIGLWTLGHFDCLLTVLDETRPIARKVTCKSLNLYQLPPD